MHQQPNTTQPCIWLLFSNQSGCGFTRHLTLLVLIVAAFGQTFLFAAAGEALEAAASPSKVEDIIQIFRQRIGIAQEIRVVVVRQHERLASVRFLNSKKKAFLLSFDRDFLAALSADELEAVVAHELGHVWIFTHRPYLHTEYLANQKALKLVPRRSLEKVYGEVWKHHGGRGDIESFLGK